jgi:hypothetical protein
MDPFSKSLARPPAQRAAHGFSSLIGAPSHPQS